MTNRSHRYEIRKLIRGLAAYITKDPERIQPSVVLRHIQQIIDNADENSHTIKLAKTINEFLVTQWTEGTLSRYILASQCMLLMYEKYINGLGPKRRFIEACHQGKLNFIFPKRADFIDNETFALMRLSDDDSDQDLDQTVRARNLFLIHND